MFQIAPFTSASLSLWLVFAGIVYTVARYAPLWCLPLGHFSVAVIFYQMNVAWMTHEMRKPEWNGTPDIDIIFACGVLAEIGFVCFALLPFTALGLYLKWRHHRQAVRSGRTSLGISFVS